LCFNCESSPAVPDHLPLASGISIRIASDPKPPNVYTDNFMEPPVSGITNLAKVWTFIG
jgi:hypothetical protein